MVSRVQSTNTPATASASGRLALPVVLYLLAVMLPIGFNVGPLFLTTVRLVLLVSIVPLSVLLLVGKFGRVMVPDVCFILFLMWAAMSYSIHHPDGVVEHIGSNGTEFWGGYLMGRCFIRTREQFISLCKMLCVMVSITLPLALYESQTGDPLVMEIIRRIPGVRTDGNVYHDLRMGLERSQVIFAHPILYGLFCSVAFSLTFVGLQGSLGDTRRWIASGIVGLCTFLSLSSGALLALLLQIFMIGWFLVFRKHEWKWTYLLILFTLSYLFVVIASDRPPVRVFMAYATFNPQTAFWRAIIFEWGMMNIFGSEENNIPPSPWIGIGRNDWVRPHFMFSGSFDNFWLLMAMTYGVPAFLFLATGYLSTLFRAGFRDFSGDTQLENIRRAWIFTFAGLTFSLITVHIWATIYSFVFFMFGAGIWLLTVQPRNGETTDTVEDTSPKRASRYTRFPTVPRPDLSPDPQAANLQLKRGSSR